MSPEQITNRSAVREVTGKIRPQVKEKKREKKEKEKEIRSEKEQKKMGVSEANSSLHRQTIKLLGVLYGGRKQKGTNKQTNKKQHWALARVLRTIVGEREKKSPRA